MSGADVLKTLKEKKVKFVDFRFTDTKGKEQIFVHGQRNYDLRVENDMMDHVRGNRHSVIGKDREGDHGGDHLIYLEQDRHMEVKRNEVIKVGGNREELVAGDYDNIVKGTHKEKIEIGRAHV